MYSEVTRRFIADLHVGHLAVRILLAVILGELIALHYLWFAQVLSNKRKFTGLLVMLCATTLLVISVIKASLALSLGLVGALSIIRFRTPVKEAEELAYLFLAIAAGIGLGAGQEVVTCATLVALMLYMGLRKGFRAPTRYSRTLLQVSLAADADDARPHCEAVALLLSTVRSKASNVDLRRVDAHAGELHMGVLLDVRGPDGAEQLIGAVEEALPAASVTLVERDSMS